MCCTKMGKKKSNNLTAKKKRLHYLNKIIQNEHKNGFLQLASVNNQIKFKCLRCGRCCRLAQIFLLNEDLKTKILKKNVETWNSFFKLTRKYDTCVFLEKRDGICSCSVYDKRPLCCQCYPFFIINGSLYYDTTCPGVGEGMEISIADLSKIRQLRKKISDYFIASIGENEMNSLTYSLLKK